MLLVKIFSFLVDVTNIDWVPYIYAYAKWDHIFSILPCEQKRDNIASKSSLQLYSTK